MTAMQVQMQLVLLATVASLASNLGSVPAYWAGARGGRPMVERYGRWVLLSRRDLDRVDHFFARYGSITVLVGRMLPIIRTFIAFPAGVAKMNQARFHIYTFVGSWPWCYVLAYVGMRLGAVVEQQSAVQGGVSPLPPGSGGGAGGGVGVVRGVALAGADSRGGGMSREDGHAVGAEGYTDLSGLTEEAQPILQDRGVKQSMSTPGAAAPRRGEHSASQRETWNHDGRHGSGMHDSHRRRRGGPQGTRQAHRVADADGDHSAGQTHRRQQPADAGLPAAGQAGRPGVYRVGHLRRQSVRRGEDGRGAGQGDCWRRFGHTSSRSSRCPRRSTRTT